MSYSTPQAALQAYIDGTRDLDRQKLSTCFHPNAIMTGYLKGQAIFATPVAYLDDVDRMAAGGVSTKDYKATIGSLTVQGPVASAALIESGLAGMNFNDFMHLVEEDGRWSIISKLFTTV